MGALSLSIIALGAFALFAIWFVGIGINEKIKRNMINRNGVATTGTIIERKSRGREPGSVYYSFQHEDRTYTGDQRVSFNHMDRINIGDKVDIRYLPSDPNVALLAGGDADDPWSTTPIVAGSLILILTLSGLISILAVAAP